MYLNTEMQKYWCILLVFNVINTETTNENICFPSDVTFGVGASAYQVEGAWNVSGKGESIWDHYTHSHPDRISHCSNGDIAADSYHKFKEDVRLLTELKVHYYSFSISWTRIMTDPRNGSEINADGISYYRELIDELDKNDIVPLVTMYHWDLPQTLQDRGGWTNPLTADYFELYAKVLFDNFGDKVQTWITFNDPYTFCREGYGGTDAPGAMDSGVQDYQCGHNVIRAHSRVYRLFDREYRPRYGGHVGIALNLPWQEPGTTAEEDLEAAETARQFIIGWFAHPIFRYEGDYPPVMRQRIDQLSKHQNITQSRLPTFDEYDLKIITRSADFLGLNHYTTYLVRKGYDQIGKPSFEADMGVVTSQNSEWATSNSTWLRVVPWGLRKALNWIKSQYYNTPVIITENGVPLEPGLSDTYRANYIKLYLKSLHEAIIKDDCNVLSYTYKSLMDSFEWTRGYSERFGLFEVDYASSNRTRKRRYSAAYYRNITTTLCLSDI